LPVEIVLIRMKGQRKTVDYLMDLK